MTGELIERVAKAIAKVRECEPTAERVASCIWGHDNVEGYSCICLMAARAAIEAMREPTEDMLMEACALECLRSDCMREGKCQRSQARLNMEREHWQAVLDAALATP